MKRFLEWQTWVAGFLALAATGVVDRFFYNDLNIFQVIAFGVAGFAFGKGTLLKFFFAGIAVAVVSMAYLLWWGPIVYILAAGITYAFPEEEQLSLK